MVHTPNEELEAFDALGNLIEAVEKQVVASESANKSISLVANQLRAQSDIIAADTQRIVNQAMGEARRKALADLNDTAAAAVSAKDAYVQAAKFAGKTWVGVSFVVSFSMIVGGIMIFSFYTERANEKRVYIQHLENRAEGLRHEIEYLKGKSLDVHDCNGSLCVRVFPPKKQHGEYQIIRRVGE